MRRILIVIGLILFSFQQVEAVDYFRGTYEQALRKAEQEDKLVLLYFSASWCGPCHYMSQNFFTERSVKSKIRRSYIFLNLDIDDPKTMTIYRKYVPGNELTVPRFYLINYNEEVIKKQEGATTLSFFKEFVGVSPEDYQEGTDDYQDEKEYRRNSAFDRFAWNSFLSKWKLGIKAGVNFNNLRTSGLYTKYDGFKTGYNFGIFAERATKYFMFEPGIAFYRKGGKDSDLNKSIKLSYIEIPVKMSVNVWHHNFWGRQPVRLNVEPYVACALGGKITNYAGTEKVHFGKGRNDFNRFDYGVKVGASCQLGSFEPSLGYDFGLNNLSNNPNGTSYNRGFYFNVALLFGR